MCMLLLDHFNIKEYNTTNKNKPLLAVELETEPDSKTIIGWKVISTPWDKDGDGVLGTSLIYRHNWKQGINKSNRESTELTKSESINSKVRKGFHVFTTLKAAKDYNDRCNEEMICPVRIEPEHVVAVGYTSSPAPQSDFLPTVIATELELLPPLSNR